MNSSNCSGVISIHALREEGDSLLQSGNATILISIHALREEGDTHSEALTWSGYDFYPRPP